MSGGGHARAWAMQIECEIKILLRAMAALARGR